MSKAKPAIFSSSYKPWHNDNRLTLYTKVSDSMITGFRIRINNEEKEFLVGKDGSIKKAFQQLEKFVKSHAYELEIQSVQKLRSKKTGRVVNNAAVLRSDKVRAMEAASSKGKSKERLTLIQKTKGKSSRSNNVRGLQSKR